MVSKIGESYLEINGNFLLVADALIKPFTEDNTKQSIGKYGIMTKDVKEYFDRGQGVQIAQLYKLVIPGLILSRHIFEGLNRNLYDDNKRDSDKKKLIYSRTSTFDVDIDNKTENITIRKRESPKGKVFVVIVSPNDRHRDKYPQIDGWIDRWNWVEQDPGLQEAPINWVDRYEKRLFTRS